jgi:hypothetical protein
MEKNKLDLSIGNRLLEARSESLQQMKELTLRPHGKLWGMDVFSWYQPNVNLLANTLHSFPFPVLWIGNARDIVCTLEEDATVCDQLHAVITFDHSFFTVPYELASKIRNVAGVNNASDAFSLLKALKKKNAVLLFSATGENWKEEKEKFESFLNMHQAL